MSKKYRSDAMAAILARRDKRGVVWQLCWIPLGGYVKFGGDPNVTRTGLVLGSPAYIAPERARPPIVDEMIPQLGPPRFGVLDGRAERGANTAATKSRADKYSAQPGSQVFASLKIVHAKGGGSQKLSIRMRNPCNRQFISIHVRL